MLPSPKHPSAVDTSKSLTRSQQDALRAIAFFRRQRKLGTGWLVGDKRLSEKLVGRLEQLDLVEESVVRGEPSLQLTIIGQAIRARLLQ
ncbi:hypothetical protein HT585_29585 [Ensifer sp. HO-A22]|jgi:hypothetical protein|uniref:Uncharacterized protein n=1 Tax=Ensifer oleiphilus TaxID=2742698 RepID=A0A7Y6URP0_9HYPH|nr:hypothetical protein [Ensifer oleiphilus]NVD43023.1 hypothetical protein [Ensifer oleiphilus]